MSCKTLQLKNCEIAGSTFQGRRFNFPNRDISSDNFTMVVGTKFRELSEIPGVVVGDEVLFYFTTLEGLNPDLYYIEYWAEFQGVGKEMIAIEEFTISKTPCSSCGDQLSASFVLEFPEETINYTVDFSIINIGTSASWDNITDKPTEFPPTTHTHTWTQITEKPIFFSGAYADLTGKPVLFSGNYNNLSNKPTIPADQVNSDWNSNSGISQILNKPTLFSGSYIDLTNKPTLFSGSYTELTNKPTIFDGTWSSLTGKPSVFTPSAHTHLWSDITNPPTLFSGNYNDLTNKPALFNGTWASLTGKPATFTPPVAAETVLGGVKVWFGTQAQYDAITTKQTDTLYYIQS